MVRFAASALVLVFALSGAASAMDVAVVGDQMILSGPVVGDDHARVARLIAERNDIRTVILRNSPGGHAPTGYAVGELFRQKGLHTAVSGYCYSSCSRMFLGGRERSFTDDYAPEYTHVGFHGHYDNAGHLMSQLVRRLGLKGWIIRHSDGKADEELVERWINIPRNIGMIHFFHPELVKRDGISTFMCQGDEKTTRGVFGCEPIARTAVDLGIVTSLDLVHSNDQATVRAAVPLKPAKSDFAAIGDASKVPVPPAGLVEYRRFLDRAPPRAFAVDPEGTTWGWVSGPMDSMRRALERCAERARRACRLYAVDHDVVWTPAAAPPRPAQPQ
jgi:hypothetical protein